MKKWYYLCCPDYVDRKYINRLVTALQSNQVRKDQQPELYYSFCTMLYVDPLSTGHVRSHRDWLKTTFVEHQYSLVRVLGDGIAMQILKLDLLSSFSLIFSHFQNLSLGLTLRNSDGTITTNSFGSGNDMEIAVALCSVWYNIKNADASHISFVGGWPLLGTFSIRPNYAF